MADLSVMYQPLGGGWVKLGTQHGGGRGVLPESIQLEGDKGEGGCLAASFKLKQDPRWIANELAHFTPIAVWDGAECVWSGRVAMTPTTFGESDVEVVIQCQGWWQHLKDQTTAREWVIDDLSRWYDARQAPVYNLAGISMGTQVAIDDGSILFTLPSGGKVPSFGTIGAVVLDLGPNNLAQRVVVTHESSSNHAFQVLYVAATATPNWGTSPSYFISAAGIGAGPTTVSGTAATPGRYVSLVWYHGTAGAYTAANDEWFRVTSVKVFTDTADESGNASVLKASTVISEVLDECCPLISPRRDRITTTALSLPQFPGSPGRRYPHELVKQANAVHGYIARLTPDPLPVFEFFPVPTDYRFVVGEGEYTLLEPAAQDGQMVASRAITEYEDASGVRAEAIAFVPSSPTFATATPQLTNPSFDTNTTGWSNVGGSIARDTGVFDSSPASLSLTRDAYSESFTSNLVIGTAYRFVVRARISSGTNDIALHVTDPGVAGVGSTAAQRVGYKSQSGVSTTFVDIAVDFVARATTHRLTVQSVGFGVYPAAAYVDSIVLQTVSGSVVTRRGFTRDFLRPMTHRTTLATAQAVAQLELDDAQYPPFKGTIEVVGTIPLKGGGHLDVAHLPALVGENILLKNLHDPNTQALGRKGNITTAIYDHAKRRTLIGIDRDLRFITQLRARLDMATR